MVVNWPGLSLKKPACLMQLLSIIQQLPTSTVSDVMIIINPVFCVTASWTEKVRIAVGEVLAVEITEEEV